MAFKDAWERISGRDWLYGRRCTLEEVVSLFQKKLKEKDEKIRALTETNPAKAADVDKHESRFDY